MVITLYGDAQKHNVLVKSDGKVIFDFEEVEENTRNYPPELPEVQHIMKAPYNWQGDEADGK